EQHLGQPYDTNGEWAASGISSCELLEALLNHPYFDRPPPKSTGRELFGAAYLRDVFARLPNAEIEPADVQATLLEFTVESIGRSIETTQSRLETVYVCGG
ncbi:MAG: anhydro-N-acetylmuramic acid kinase, partial [Gammaproteobacteria bacterium]